MHKLKNHLFFILFVVSLARLTLITWATFLEIPRSVRSSNDASLILFREPNFLISLILVLGPTPGMISSREASEFLV